MEIRVFQNKEEMSRAGAGLIIAELEKNKNRLLCAATGNTPTETYGFLKNEFGQRPELFPVFR